MRRMLFSMLVMLGSFAFAYGQENKDPLIFTELGKSSSAEIKKTCEKFYQTLKADNAQGYIVNFGTGKEIAGREKQLRDSINFRDENAPRITFIRGRNLRKLKSVFYVVPTGAEPPALSEQKPNGH